MYLLDLKIVQLTLTTSMFYFDSNILSVFIKQLKFIFCIGGNYSLIELEFMILRNCIF